MRVKAKGFEVGKSYSVYDKDQKGILDNYYVFFSKKNYVLVSHNENKYKKSKNQFKDFLRLFPMKTEEMDNDIFFDDFHKRYDKYTSGYDEEYSDTFPCGCCTCCGCSCDDHLFYDYDYDDE
jgi:hypothetical protein